MNIYKINSEKFKSIYISYNFTMNVRDTKIFSYNAILGALMAKSSNKYKTQKEIEKYLNGLYGTIYDVNIEKYGDLYNLEFRTEFINKKFIPNNEELLDRVLRFLYDMIYDTTNWSDELISREKEYIIERIMERKDEKLRYGVQRAEELMCKDEPYGTFLYGDEKHVNDVDKDILSCAYSELLNSAVTVIVSGNLSGYENIEKNIGEIFQNEVKNNTRIEDLDFNIGKYKEKDEEIVEENQDTVQSVLALGYQVKNIEQADFYATNVFNAIFGTTPSSKLFQNVREKESLAYTVRSRYYRFKDMIIVYAGINKENYNRAKMLIQEQLETIKSGDISDIELNSAKDSIISDLKEWNDSKISMEKMIFANKIGFKRDNVTVDDMIENINKVSLEDVVEIANKTELKKIFYLGGVENV